MNTDGELIPDLRGWDRYSWICHSHWRPQAVRRQLPDLGRRSFLEIEEDFEFPEHKLCLYYMYAHQNIRDVTILTRKLNHLHGVPNGMTYCEQEIEENLKDIRQLVLLNVEEQMYKASWKLGQRESVLENEPYWWHWAERAIDIQIDISPPNIEVDRAFREKNRSRVLSVYTFECDLSPVDYDALQLHDSLEVPDIRASSVWSRTIPRMAQYRAPNPQQKKKVDELFKATDFLTFNHVTYSSYTLLYDAGKMKDIEEIDVLQALSHDQGSSQYWACLGIEHPAPPLALQIRSKALLEENARG